MARQGQPQSACTLTHHSHYWLSQHSLGDPRQSENCSPACLDAVKHDDWAEPAALDRSSASTGHTATKTPTNHTNGFWPVSHFGEDSAVSGTSDLSKCHSIISNASLVRLQIPILGIVAVNQGIS